MNSTMFETKDLVLRTVTDDDINEVARMWYFEKGSISTHEAEKVIQNMRENRSRNKAGSIYHLCLAVYEKGGNSIIGWCGLDGKSGNKLHIFFMIDADCRNRGYATQCAKRLLSYAFDEAKVAHINGGCYKENIASYKVMSKVGMLQNAFEENGDPLFYIDAETYSNLNCRE